MLVVLHFHIATGPRGSIFGCVPEGVEVEDAGGFYTGQPLPLVY